MAVKEIQNINEFLKDKDAFEFDPEFKEILERFAVKDDLQRSVLDDKTKFMVIQATVTLKGIF